VADVVDEVVISTCLEYDIPHQTSSIKKEKKIELINFQDKIR